MRLDKVKDCSIQKYLETSSEYSELVQFETRSRERIAFFRTTGSLGNPRIEHMTRSRCSLCEIAKQKHLESSGAVEGCGAPACSKSSDGRL